MFGHKSKPPEIVTTLDGFSVGDFSASWQRISSIKGFKLDLLTSDLICLAVELDNDGCWFQLSEEWPGFKELSNSLESRFAFPEAWWDSVANPAFKTNETILYARA